MIVLQNDNQPGYYKVVLDKKRGDYSPVEKCNAGYTGHKSKLIHDKTNICKKVSPCGSADSKCPYNFGNFKQLQQVFTPRELCLIMADELLENYKKGGTILDPCCGAGNLLYACHEKGVPWNYLYGIDLDEEMIAFCIEHYPDGHFQLGDVLEDDFMDDRFWHKNPLTRYKPGFKFGMVKSMFS
jgi:hypothetical protein